MQRGKAEPDAASMAVRALRDALGQSLVAVVLFGSRARGDARESSDWDLLVIADGLPENLFQRHLFLKPLLPPGCRGAVSIQAKTPEEFESHVPSLYLDIALDGRVMYDPQKYATERLAALRRQIKRAGLYREHTPAGDVWRWLREPTGSREVEWEK